QRYGVAGQGNVAGFAALAGQRGHGRALEADVADGEGSEFLDPGPGVVERGEQGRIAPALTGGAGGLGGQAAGLLDSQVADGGAVLFLGGYGEDVLPAGHPGRVLGLHPRAERADRGQALVAGRDAVVPAFLQPAEERRDGERSNGQIILGPPKSRAGLRTVSIPATILPDIAAHLAKHTRPDANALVFTGIKGGPLRRSGFNNSAAGRTWSPGWASLACMSTTSGTPEIPSPRIWASRCAT